MAAGFKRETVTFYHIADLHIDPNYTIGGKRENCGNVMCCRGEMAKKEADRAGQWGDYNCDLPIWTLKQIHHSKTNTGNPDFFIWTGDNIAHDIHKLPEDSATATLQISEYVQQNFPEAIIFPIHGNHEFAPMNLQDLEDPHDKVINWLADVWAEWMPEEVIDQFRKQSFYEYPAWQHPKASPEFARKMKGTRFIGANLQTCYFFNFYLMSEMGGELHEIEWLEETLRTIEQRGEKVILYAHIPPGGSDCMESFSRRYAALMDRYQHVIRTTLYAHDHTESFNLMRAVKSGKAINQEIVTGSLTTFTGENPSFRVIHLDAEHMVPVSIETYFLNLTYYNSHPEEEAIFTKLYEMKEEYGLKDLRPSNLDRLSHDFLVNEELARKYRGNRNARAHGVPQTCDAQCRLDYFCQTQFNVHADTMACKNSYDGMDMLHLLFTPFEEPWFEPVK